MILILKALSRLPLGFLYLISDVLAWAAGSLFKYRRQVVVENLRNSFPDKSEVEINQITKDFYAHLADLIVETIKAITIPSAALDKRVFISNSEILEDCVRRFPAVVVLTVHLGNWEWMNLACCTQLTFPIAPLYLRLTNKGVDRLMLTTRSRFGGEPLPSFRALVRAMRDGSKNRAYVLFADQTPPPSTNNHWTRFLNQETAFLPGIEELPRIMNCPVFFVSSRRTQRGHYDVRIEKISEPPHEEDGHAILNSYVGLAEKVISKAPHQWLWSHRRWKHSKPLEG